MPTEPTSEGDLVSQILTLVGEDPGAFEPSGSTGDLFRRATKKQLVDCAQRLGLTGISKLGKDELAARIEVAFDAVRGPIVLRNGNGGGTVVPIDGGAPFPQKFDLGPSKETEALPQNIPWGYGQNRVTAMVVDPDRLFVYWEVTDDALTAARERLGPGGAGAWLNLRVYDITGRLFDGTNAHSYFDHHLERHDRQWFFAINKPTSATCAEVGLLSGEGYFAKIARSGRVEFPRREPVGGGAVDWLSVRTASGPVGAAFAGAAPGPGGAPVPATGPGAGGGAGEGLPPGLAHEGWREWAEVEGIPGPGGQRVFGRRWQWQEADGTEWTSDLARSEWVGPVLRTEWEAGPFAYPVEAPSLVEVHDTGELSIRTEGGLTHVMYGPWQVVIRGLGARAERRVLSTWEYRRRVDVTGGIERSVFARGTLAPGSSEWLMLGASERAWMGASELLYRGGSELWLLGASELLLRGASETLFTGASEYRLRGASERLQRGASELLLRGASERRLGGASETLFAGASERARGGASEMYLGASERLQRGASERWGGSSEQQRRPAETPGSLYPWPGAMAETD